MKKYKLIGLEIYAYDCRGVFHAITTFMSNGIGITENNLEEFEGEIPENAMKVFEGI